MKIEAKLNLSGVKRCHLEPAPLFIVKCPDCSRHIPVHKEQVSYPKIDEIYEYVAACEMCKKEWVGLMSVKKMSIEFSTDESDLVGYEYT